MTPGAEVQPRCRVCDSAVLEPVLDLGAQYIAGAFFREAPPPFYLERHPLALVRCSPGPGRPSCGLVQLAHTVPRDALFTRYGYRSGVNQTMRENLRDIARRTEAMACLAPGDTVLDIGCNDGTLLAAYRTEGLDLLGMDPAEDVTRYARERGIEVVGSFFSSEAFRRVRGERRARAITAIAMFYDLEDPPSFVRQVREVLSDDGVFAIELSWLPLMLRNRGFDSICHEHLEYYCLAQIEWLVQDAGMVVHDAEVNGINGGSFRVFIRPREAGPVPPDASARVQVLRDEERSMALGTPAPYARFRQDCEGLRGRLRDLVLGLLGEGRTIHAYGASTKGNVILQYCGLDRRHIRAAADRNPDKWGTRMLGTEIPVISEEDSRAARPDYFLALPYHFIDEFVRRESAYLALGGRFILPIPEVRVVGGPEA
ncbi:MAG: class I SAM-dependent methyltransferase [Planctomycetes bacterium]|nr:class I SAM-dependent methyltransferase [Planctomycetota bacterium]